MYANTNPVREYQRQALASSSPLQLVVKLYDLGISACHTGDRKRLRAVLVELVSGLDFEHGGDIAARLSEVYEYCISESANGDLDLVGELLFALREAWRQIISEHQP